MAVPIQVEATQGVRAGLLQHWQEVRRLATIENQKVTDATLGSVPKRIS